MSAAPTPMDVSDASAEPKVDDKAEPTTAAGMMKSLAKIEGGSSVMKESMKTFSNTEGKNKKGDVYVSASDMPAALEALKLQIEAAKAKAKPGKKLDMWNFKASPHAEMGKTLDDSFVAFLMWARTGSQDDDGFGGGERDHH